MHSICTCLATATDCMTLSVAKKKPTTATQQRYIINRLGAKEKSCDACFWKSNCSVIKTKHLSTLVLNISIGRFVWTHPAEFNIFHSIRTWLFFLFFSLNKTNENKKFVTLLKKCYVIIMRSDSTNPLI